MIILCDEEEKGMNKRKVSEDNNVIAGAQYVFVYPNHLLVNQSTFSTCLLYLRNCSESNVTHSKK